MSEVARIQRLGRKEIALFPQVQPRCPAGRFRTLSLRESPNLRREQEPAWPPGRAAFRDLGLGRSKGRLSVQTPRTANPAGKPREAARDRELTLRGPPSQPPRPPRPRRQGRSGGASTGRARGRPATAEPPRGEGLGAEPLIRGRTADGVGPRALQERAPSAEAAACSAFPRPESRSLPTNYARRALCSAARRLPLPSRTVPGAAQNASSLKSVAFYGLFSTVFLILETVPGSEECSQQPSEVHSQLRSQSDPLEMEIQPCYSSQTLQ
ncbi:uncharacterized protein LOC125124706 [Phacochoerus africanus]|uniref:uncharacterized protein LOC125124706 n=1 Tax=Phacochoerus africanus TaxID=41426 RepID=UPI001FD9D983|nr:uncharacterized protein LOC125124706 [Phacochoerus africanus]